MHLLTSFNQVLVILMLLFVGYFANKKEMIDIKTEKNLSTMVLYIFLPSMIIKAMNYKFSKELMNNSLKLLFISIIIYFIAIIFSYFIIRFVNIEEKKKDIIQYILIFPNVGFMGYPIVNILYKDLGIFYTAFFNMPFNLLCWTIGIHIMSRHYKKDSKLDLKKIFLNPGFVAILIGYTLFLTGFKLPFFIDKTLSLLGPCTTPISMIVIGSSISRVDFLSIFKDKALLKISFLRLIVIPICIFIVLKLIGLKGMMLGIPTVIMAMPAAANTVIFANKFNNDDLFASKGVVLSTLISIITIPIIMSLISLF
ncbi:AEC family transporter [Peptostreptococcaceae bacterium AGR-M142]